MADRVTPERGQRWESRDRVYDAGRQVRLLHRYNHSPLGAWVAEVVAYPRRPHLVGGQTRLSDVTLRKKWKPIDA